MRKNLRVPAPLGQCDGPKAATYGRASRRRSHPFIDSVARKRENILFPFGFMAEWEHSRAGIRTKRATIVTAEEHPSSEAEVGPENAGPSPEHSGPELLFPDQAWIPEAGYHTGGSGGASESGLPCPVDPIRGTSFSEACGPREIRAAEGESPLAASGSVCDPFDPFCGLEGWQGGDVNANKMRYLGIRLRKGGQVFFFPDRRLAARIGSKVIVECEQGTAFGEVDSIFFSDVPPDNGEAGQSILGQVVGLATAKDIAWNAENRILSAEATAFCTTCIRQRALDMKLVDVEVLHDRSKIIFYFTAPSRIDFRELVKDLVRNYRTRIELRQIGVRHETQMIGGLGNCGMVCCCHKYLRKFAPVTIKMAKEQNLFLNPAKLSGMCGRLLCCLSFEQSNYEEFNRRCPKLGKKYTTTTGTFKVIRANMFNQSIVVCSDAGEESEYSLEEWESKEPRRTEHPAPEAQRAPQPQRPPGEGGRRGRSKGQDERGGIERKASEDGNGQSSGQAALSGGSLPTEGAEENEADGARSPSGTDDVASPDS